jgi:hypothetical protein
MASGFETKEQREERAQFMLALGFSDVYVSGDIFGPSFVDCLACGAVVHMLGRPHKDYDDNEVWPLDTHIYRCEGLSYRDRMQRLTRRGWKRDGSRISNENEETTDDDQSVD